MRLLLILLALVAAPAWAEWVKVIENSELVAYIDPTTIRKNGNFRKVWEMLDLKQKADDGEMSYRTYSEYDCKENRIRTISMSSHSEPMLGGKMLVSDDDPGKWKAIPPNTIVQNVHKTVCAK